VTERQLDPFTAEWNAWFSASVDAHMKNLRLRVNTSSIEAELIEKHFKPIVELLNETRRDILALRKELGLALPEDDARIEITNEERNENASS
jgi:hypothetical protein